ncbi:hypothetical protein H0H93_005841 [Arthromyces matolae]|nr:hypothetical protein H0H93_005841 [Arthromyces matolae]
MLQYLYVFADVHHDFRIPELHSIAELHGFSFTLAEKIEDGGPMSPYMVIGLEREEHALILARRCILVKSVYEFYAQGSSYDELHTCNRAKEAQWARYIPDTSFRFFVTAHNHKIPQSRQRDVVESFAYMGLLGKIDMRNPQIMFGCFEEYLNRDGLLRNKHQGDGYFRQVFFGRLIEEGSARQLIHKFDVKKRVFYGNTSMEAEISLLMANQTLASPGRLIYDPFMGTGSMAYTTTHFGALVFGSDIDGRQMRGKGKRPGILSAASQYGTESRILDLCTFDVTKNPWRCGGLFDAIVTDPPYGVRAGAKRLGRKKELSEEKQKLMLEHRIQPRTYALSLSSMSVAIANQVRYSDDQPYFPPTKPYELSHLAVDLVILARYLLKPGGRLVFFLPTVTDEYEELDVQSMLCEGMEVIANSLQDFGSWGRRLVTVRKTTDQNHGPPLFEPQTSTSDQSHVPAHKDFREKYFQGFKKEEEAW